MKHFIATLILAASAVTGAMAGDVVLRDVTVENTGGALSVAFTVDATQAGIRSNEELRVVPALQFADGREVEFETLVFAGHNRRIRLERNASMLGNARLVKDGVATVDKILPFEEWMGQPGNMHTNVIVKGCCSRVNGEYAVNEPFDLTPVPVFVPEFVFVTPEVEERKVRDLSGSAYVDFRLNRTDIDADYRQNPRELATISQTIDAVKNDADVTIKHVSFKGYASPEGPYDNNARLAKGRTAALCEYVQKLHNFEKGIISSSSEPEDWAGLRKAVAAGNLPNRAAILRIIDDTSLQPDARDRALATQFPDDYAFLLQSVYPALRHCDYVIQYEVRHYDDPAEILALVETAPHKLSEREFFVAAKTLQPGTAQYNKVFETAARMYPLSETANLNAAVIRLSQGDNAGAREFLAKAGNSPVAVYTRAVEAALSQDYTTARGLFQQAAAQGVDQANAAIAQLDKAGK